MKRRPVHGATVEQVRAEDDAEAYQAVCLETGAVCDAWGYPECLDVAPDERHGDGIQHALDYMSDPDLHGPDDDGVTWCDAEHVMEHDR